LALASTNVVFANPKFNPRKEQRLVSEEHEQWLTLQRQQLPYVDDPADATSLKLVQVVRIHFHLQALAAAFSNSWFIFFSYFAMVHGRHSVDSQQTPMRTMTMGSKVTANLHR